jgi:hypothetical protein
LSDYNVGLLTLAIRKGVLNTLDKPFFNPKYNIIGDFELVMNASLITRIEYIPKPLACYRIHNSNLSILQREKFVIEIENWHNDHLNLKKFGELKNFRNIKAIINYNLILTEVKNGNYKVVLTPTFLTLKLKHKINVLVSISIHNTSKLLTYLNK